MTKPAEKLEQLETALAPVERRQKRLLTGVHLFCRSCHLGMACGGWTQRVVTAIRLGLWRITKPSTSMSLTSLVTADFSAPPRFARSFCEMPDRADHAEHRSIAAKGRVFIAAIRICPTDMGTQHAGHESQSRDR